MEVTCINDKDRPDGVPTSRWVKEGETYTITKVMVMKQQGRIGGVKLAEINNDDLFPYTYFRVSRFALSEEQLLKLINLKELEVEELVTV